MAKPVYQRRYRIHAYVARGSVKSVFREERVTIAWIYQGRPSDHRYAVVSTWDVNEHSRQYAVIDLFAIMKDLNTNQLIEPEPRLVTPELAAAKMAAVILYDSPEVRHG